MKALLLSSLLLILLSCEQKTQEKTNSSKATHAKKTKIDKGLRVVDTLSFRRSYVGHENMTNKEVEELHQSNPTLETYDSTSVLVKKLNAKGLLKKNEFLIQKIEGKTITNDFLDKDHSIKLTIQSDKEALSKIYLNINHDKANYTKTLDFEGDHILGILLEDLNDDGVKEILILTNFYIMNGDNYILTIVEYV